MRIEKLMLDKMTHYKYQTYLELFTMGKSSCTNNELIQKLGYSNRTLNEILKQLSTDLAELGAPDALLISRKEGITIQSLTVNIATYRSYLIQKALVFKFVEAVAFKKDSVFYEFIRQEFVSESTMMRKLKPLMELVEEYKLKINIKKMTFIGEEKNIRLFLLTLYWLSFKGTIWPFATVSHKKVEAIRSETERSQNLKLGLIEKNEMDYFYGVTLLRISLHQYIQPNKKFDQFCLHNPNFHPEIYQSLASWVPEDKQRAEFSFLYISSFFKPKFDEMNPRLKQMLLYFEEEDNEIWQFSNEIIDRLKAYAPSKAKQLSNPVLRGNLLTILLANYVMGVGYINVFLLTDPVIRYGDNGIKEKTDSVFSQLDWKKYPNFYEVRNQLTKYFLYLFTSIFEEQIVGKKLRVGIIYDPNVLLFRGINKFLDASPYNVESQSIHEIQQEFDLIISATYIPDNDKSKEKPPIYYWNFERHKDNFVKLLLILESLEKEKYG